MNDYGSNLHPKMRDNQTAPQSCHYCCGMTPKWPLFDLRVEADGIEYFYPRDEHLDRLVEIHDLIRQQPDLGWWWGDVEGLGSYKVKMLQQFWRFRSSWTHNDWSLILVAQVDGTIVGAQELFSKKFPISKSLETGSWVHPDRQGLGYGKKMRAMALDFAFQYLGAEQAASSAALTNSRSAGVSRAMGYRDNGRKRSVLGGQPVDEQCYLVTREDWQQRDRNPGLQVQGFDACKPFFFPVDA